MPLLARPAASAIERTLVYFRMNMYIRPPTRVSIPARRIKSYRAVAGLGPTIRSQASCSAEMAAHQLPLCPFNDRIGVAMQYVAKGHFQTWPACFLSEMAT